MKKSVSILIAAAIFASAPALKAEPDITDLLKGAAGALKGGSGEGSGSTALSGLKGMVEGLISKSNLSEADRRLMAIFSSCCSIPKRQPASESRRGGSSRGHN